jgi:hypothetical protein
LVAALLHFLKLKTKQELLGSGHNADLIEDQVDALLAVLKPNRIIRKRTYANCISFHLRVLLGLSNPRDRGRLALYLYPVIALVKENLSLT